MGTRALAAGAAMLLSACAPAGSSRAVPGGASGAPDAPMADSLRFEAVQALQHVRRGPFLAADDVRDVARGIGVVRDGFPAVRDVRNRRDEAAVQVRLADSLGARLAARFPARDTLVRETGIAGVDSLNRALGAAGTRIRWEDGPVLEPRFDRPVNAAALATRYGQLPGVRSALPPQFIADDPWTGIRAGIAGDAITYTFVRGWGDCLSGCIHQPGWTFTYDRRTGRARLTGESGDPLP